MRINAESLAGAWLQWLFDVYHYGPAMCVGMCTGCRAHTQGSKLPLLAPCLSGCSASSGSIKFYDYLSRHDSGQTQTNLGHWTLGSTPAPYFVS